MSFFFIRDPAIQSCLMVNATLYRFYYFQKGYLHVEIIGILKFEIKRF